MLNNNRLIFATVIMQNCLHPKNSHRTTSISENKYVEIRELADAERLLSDLLKDCLTKELMGVQTAIMSSLADNAREQSTALLLNAPDKYTTAAMLTINKIC